MAKLKAWINEHRTDIEKGQFGYEQGKAGSNLGLNASEVMKEKAKTEQE